MDKITITITPTFRGYFVELDRQAPTHGDPLGQQNLPQHFATVDEAVDALPRLARVRLAQLGVGASS